MSLGLGPARRLHRVLGLPGLIIAAISLLAFGFGLIVLDSEYNRLRETGREAVRRIVAGWVRTVPVDYLGRTLADYAEPWQRADPSSREARLEELRQTLADLGDELDLLGRRYPLIAVEAMSLGPRGGPTLASWSPRGGSATAPGEVDWAEGIPVVPEGAGTAKAIDLDVAYRLAPEVEAAARRLETSYRRLVLALLGLSGYSLLCLGYMALHARSLSDRVARESAQEATLDLADRTCHELGNVMFVLANERRNLEDHLDLVDRFVAEAPAARAEAARRAGIDPPTLARFEQALCRSQADRGIDPDVELAQGVAIARDVCRQVAICTEYVALTVRELDGYLKQSALPVTVVPVDVSACLDDALALLGPRLQSAGATIDRRPEESHGARVLADRRLLVHALVNLLKNAVEAASASGSEPRINLSVQSEGPTLWIGLADNGPGIPEASLPRIFDVGFSTKGAGRGRGLAIVRESVRSQGGELRVSSRPGAGTEFRIGLPLDAIPAREIP